MSTTESNEKPSLSDADRDALREGVVDALKTIFDPEIPVNIYDMGLVYGVDVQPDGHVIVQMTLTSPACPVAESLPAEVEVRTKGVEGVTGAEVDLTWDPPWDPSRMSEAARLQMGFM